MYHYIIDQTRISTRNFDRLLGEVYGFLTEYQISGEVHRVTRLRNIPELVETAMQSGARTIVAIGDDHNFLQLVELLAESDSVVLGFIPLVKNSEIAQVLGIANLEEACQAIAKRRADEFDIGRVGRNYFFTSLNFGLLNAFRPNDKKLGPFAALGLVSKLRALPSIPIKVEVDGKYSLTASILAGTIINARVPGLCESQGELPFSSPRDGKLDLLLVEKLGTRDLIKYRKFLSSGCFENIPGGTVLHGRNFEIEGPKNLNIATGGLPLNRTAASVSVADKSIRVIVGKAYRM